MTPEERAAALKMLGGGMAAQAGQAIAGRGQQIADAEAAASGAQPMPTMPTAPAAAMPAEKSPGMMRKLADMLRGAGK